MLRRNIARALVLCFLFALVPLTDAAPRSSRTHEKGVGASSVTEDGRESLACRVVGILNLSLIRKRFLRCSAPDDGPVVANPTNSTNTITDNPDPSLADDKDGEENEETEEDGSVAPFQE